MYKDVLAFAKKKYKSVASEIPGFGTKIRPDLLVAKRKEWLRIREEWKRDVHEQSQRSREANARRYQEAISDVTADFDLPVCNIDTTADPSDDAEVLPHVSLVACVERARGEAEVAFRQREITERWGLWSGVHPWDYKSNLETTDCPWWVAGGEYVFRVVVEWRTHATPEGREALLSKHVIRTAQWVYWNRVFFHDRVHSKNPKPEDLRGDIHAERFCNFAFLFALQRFAEENVTAWRERAALLGQADTDLEFGDATPSESQPVGDASDPRAQPEDPPEFGPGTDVNTNQEDTVAAERCEKMSAFKAKGRRRCGIRITDEMVAEAASSGKWSDRTMIGWWKRNDPRCKPPHDRKIRALLDRDPASVWTSEG